MSDHCDPAELARPQILSASSISLSAAPDWASEKSVILDRAYDEYCQRLEAGASVNVKEFCDQFPAHRSSLRRMLEIHQFLHENAHLVNLGARTWPEVGQELLGFTLVKQLGSGSFARVYLATEQALGGRQVALKISRLGAEEARTLGKLSHPNIVPVHSAQYDPDTGFTVLCMPYLGSTTLCDVLDRILAGSFPPKSAAILNEVIQQSADSNLPVKNQFRGGYVNVVLRIVAQLAEALAFVHELGIYHRDLKPSNVLIADDGRPMLLDFNLSFDRQVADNRLGGTLPYMSPEQLLATDLAGKADPSLVDARSDLYSLGIILYELFAGCHPFGPLPMSIQELRLHLLKKQREGARPLRFANLYIDRKLARLVDRCLAYNPAERPQSAAEVGIELNRGLSYRRRIGRWLARHRRSASAVAGTMVVLAGLGIYALANRPPYSVREYQSGQAMYLQGDFQSAVLHFNRSLAAVPDSEVLFARGRAHQQLGAFDLALADYHAACKVVDNGPTRAAIGYCQCKLGQPMAASYHLQIAVDKGYENAAVLNDLGYCYHLLGKLDPAKVTLDRALQLNPNLRATLHTRALIAFQKSQSQPGVGTGTGTNDICKAIEIGPPTTDMLRLAAYLHVEASEKEAALEYLKMAMENGQDPLALKKDIALKKLHSDPNFLELLRTTKPHGTPSKSDRILDPIALHRGIVLPRSDSAAV